MLSADDFALKLKENYSFIPHGTLLYKYKTADRTFGVYRTSCYDPGFLEYQDKLQNLMLLFIEGASQLVLEGEDDYQRWLFYLTYESISAPDGTNRYVFVGCLDAYKLVCITATVPGTYLGFYTDTPTYSFPVLYN